MGKKIEIKPGTIFGRWTVLGDAPSRKDGTATRSQFLVKCMCGTETVILGQSLVNSHSKGCLGCSGNARVEIPLGSKYGRWTVLEQRGIRNGQPLMFCECECGHRALVEGKTLRLNQSKSCKYCAKQAFDTFGEVPGHYMSRLVQGAKNRNLTVDITVEDLHNLWILQNRKCALTGWPLTLSRTRSKTSVEGNASVDRIDSFKGYSLENVQWLHKDINRLKNNYSEERFFEMCQAVAGNKDQTKELRGSRPWLIS